MASSKNLLKEFPKPLSQFLPFGIPAFFTSCSVFVLVIFVFFLGRKGSRTLDLNRRVFTASESPLLLASATRSAANLSHSPFKNYTTVVKNQNLTPPSILIPSPANSLGSHPNAALENSSAIAQGPSLPKNENRSNGSSEERGRQDLSSCDLFDGRWVLDDSSPRYPPGSCPFVDTAFNCFGNGRPDLNYTRLRWQPKGCTIPTLEGNKMLELLRGKRLVFVGDSLNRNMWESLVCILRNSLQDKHRVFEISGRTEYKINNSYAFRFPDYNCTIEFFRSTFLVREWERVDSRGRRRQTLRLDLIHQSSDNYIDADVIIFNTGHWWTHEKTSKGRNYYQEGDHVFHQLSAPEAYRKALSTWARWVDAHINPDRTRVFFRGYSWTHFSGGQWHSGGNCDGETLPITDDKHLGKYPVLIHALESVITEMRTPVLYLNITRMTDYRKDGHPSVYRVPARYRKPGDFQDCSHWCLPGVPDAWNELLYVMLLKGSGHSQE